MTIIQTQGMVNMHWATIHYSSAMENTPWIRKALVKAENCGVKANSFPKYLVECRKYGDIANSFLKYIFESQKIWCYTY